MGTVLIVVHKEQGQRVESLAVGVIRSLVGPLGLEDLDERLRLAIGLRPEGPRALQPHTPCRRGACEGAAHGAGAVVGQDTLDGDAMALEVGEGPLEEASGSRAALVRPGLDVGGAGVIIYGHVEEVEAEAGAVPGAAAGLCEAGQDALAAALGDAAQLLDV